MSDPAGKKDRQRFADPDAYERLHELVAKTLEDPEAPANDDLASFLAGDSEAQRLYVEYIQDTSVLRTHALCEVDDNTLPANDERRRDEHNEASRTTPLRAMQRRGFWAALAATLLIVVGGGLLGDDRWFTDGSPGGEIATVVRVTDVAWRGQREQALAPLTRVSSGQALEFESGQLEIVFDTGVELLVTGPAAMSIESPLKVAASRGAYTARVGERGKGFTIDTPATSVTDLGTEFGVSIQSDEATGVVVFDGSVDVTPTERGGEQDTASPIRLTQGEALAVSRGGDTQRIVAMYPGQYPTVAGRPGVTEPGESLFEKVTDNLSGSGSKKYYRIVPRGFGEDARAFVDRRHEWNGIDHSGLPRFLVGGDYVMPFNDNKFLDGLEVTVRLRSSCDLYVLFDRNMAAPAWLRDRFTNTGYGVGLDHGRGPFTGKASTQVGPGEGINDQFSVWVRRIDGPGEVVLGGADMPTDKELGWNMYGVVAVPLPGAGDAS